MLVSVIIPNYNHSGYLKQRIESVLNQTCQDFEVIIMDDCSTDNSKAIIEEYRDHPKVSAIVYNETNSGSTFKQWNKGVALGRGKYVWIAESDDMAAPMFLSTLLPVLELNERIGIAYCQSYRINSKSEITGTWKTWTDDLDPVQFQADFTMAGIDYIERFLIHKNTIPNASGVVFRKKYYSDAGGADPSIKNCSDWVTWIKMLLISDVYFCAEPLNHFRYHDQSVIATAAKNFDKVRYVEQHDRIVRISLTAYLRQNFPFYRKIIRNNDQYIFKEYGLEGQFYIRKKKLSKGWKKISKALLYSDKRFVFLSWPLHKQSGN